MARECSREWRKAAVEWFFARFFVLLLAVVSIAQWACVAWLLAMTGRYLPAALHLVAAGAAYYTNRKMIGSMRRQRDGHGWALAFVRTYSAVAFTSLFCAAFLALSGLLWGTLRLFLGALTVEAGMLQPLPADSMIDHLSHWMTAGGFGTIAVAFAYGYTIGQRRLSVTTPRIPVRYPAGLHGLKIAQISDIHIGQNLTRAQLERFVARVNALEPDLICITGDIADGPTANMSRDFPLLGRLRAPLGVVAILGNHDHYAGADKVAEALQKHTDFVVLRDQVLTIDVRGTPLHVVGLDDIGRDWARGVHSHAGLTRLEAQLPTDEPILLLCHRPETFTHAARLGIPLTLSGHTHGGQLALPWFGGRPRGLSRFVIPFDQGMFENGGCYLYVNRGLGVTGQRIRLFAPREISVIVVDPAVDLPLA
jgi:predicted MPP superfamily phosphohydrolase